MIRDAALPRGLQPPSAVVTRHGVTYTSAWWSPALLEGLARRLDEHGASALERLDPSDWLEAWGDTVEAFREPGSPERRSLDPALERATGLPPAALQAGLDAVLGGVDRDTAREISRRDPPAPGSGGILLVVLAGNLPGLAVQSLLPALVRRRATLLKTSSDEPFFTPAFVQALTSRCPPLAEAIAVATWPGGEESLEEPLLRRADTVLAYGTEEAVASLRLRTSGRLLEYGPKISVALVARDAADTPALSGLARDIALFEQRGCLSVQAVYTDADPTKLAHGLARALERAAEELPPGRITPAEAVGAHQLRVDARMRGLPVADLAPAAGTVVVEPHPTLRPSPGRRSVRVHPVDSLDAVVPVLETWRGRLQGIALAGDAAWSLEPRLQALGITRCADPGRLQTPDARWQNGGVDLLEVL